MYKMTKFLLRLLLCLAVCGLFSTCAFAVGKVVVDPNSGGSTALKTSTTNKDIRLTQKVTYETRYTSVQQILEDLTAMTGIKLYAGLNKSDWLVRSRKMNIFVKDVKMADLMNSIAHVMKFKWSRSDYVNPPTYRLVVDRKAAAMADAKMKQADNQREETLYEKRKEWVDIIMQHATMSSAEINREADPVSFYFAQLGGLEAIHALFSEYPEAKDRVIAGKSFRISTSELSSDTKDTLLSAAHKFQTVFGDHKHSNNEREADSKTDSKTDEEYDVVFSRLDVDTFTPNLRWSVYSQDTLGWFYILDGTREYEIASLRNRDSDWTKTMCSIFSKYIEGQSTAELTWGDIKANEPSNSAEADEELLYPSEPLNEHPAFDELEQNFKLKIETPEAEQNPALATNRYIASFEKALADATGMGVVSDSWVSIEGKRLPDDEAKLSMLLDEFSTQFNYNWDKSSTILEFRHRKWWKNRFNQIHDDLVATWSNNTRKSGILSLDDLAQISNLNYYQAEESLKPDMVLGITGIYARLLSILDANLQWLRFYSTLDPQQRAYLTDRWISGAMMSFGQWEQAKAVFDRLGLLRTDALFNLEIVPNDKDVIYKFREFEVTDQRDADVGKEDRMWMVTLPRYAPPSNKTSQTSQEDVTP